MKYNVDKSPNNKKQYEDAFWKKDSYIHNILFNQLVSG